MSLHEDWCDGHLDAPLIDSRHASRGTCRRCGYVGPLRERSGHVYPHKRFDRYAPEPAVATTLDEPTPFQVDLCADGWCCPCCPVCKVEDDQPCDRCAFIPTPDGKCICREVEE